MSIFMHRLVSIDIHVMYAVRHSILRVILLGINVHMLERAHIAVMCAVRHSNQRVPL